MTTALAALGIALATSPIDLAPAAPTLPAELRPDCKPGESCTLSAPQIDALALYVDQCQALTPKCQSRILAQRELCAERILGAVERAVADERVAEAKAAAEAGKPSLWRDLGLAGAGVAIGAVLTAIVFAAAQ